jgi:hypothetical protein
MKQERWGHQMSEFRATGGGCQKANTGQPRDYGVDVLGGSSDCFLVSCLGLLIPDVISPFVDQNQLNLAEDSKTVLVITQ